MDLYYKSVGRNSVFLMNVPPSDKGVIDDKEVKVIEAFTKMREAVFATNLADGATATATAVRGDNPDKYGPAKMLDGNYDSYFATNDDVVESFEIQVRSGGSWKSWGNGTKSTIGHKRIVLGSSVTADAVRIKIKSSLACPVLNGFGLYNDTVSGL